MSDPLRILAVAPTPYFSDRGCHVRIHEEARALISRGHRVLIVTYHLGRDLEGIPTVRIPPVPWYRKLSAGPSWHKPYLDLLLLSAAWRAARRFSPHLIHAHLHEGAFVGTFLSRMTGTPLLFDCQGSLTGEILDHRFVREGSLLHRLFAGIERWIDGRATHVVTSSTPLAELLTDRWGVPPERVTPLPDGVDTDRFSPGGGGEARERTGLPTGVPVVAYLGVMSRYQGVDLLLEVVKMLKERGVGIHFLMMGYPHEEYRERARAMGIGGMVTFTGRVPYGDVPPLLRSADMAVSPKLSLTEANGKLLNYLACGLATVCFDTPVNREIVGDAAVTVPLGDREGMASALARLAGDPTIRRALGERGRERAVSRLSWRVRGAELEEIVRRIVTPTSR